MRTPLNTFGVMSIHEKKEVALGLCEEIFGPECANEKKNKLEGTPPHTQIIWGAAVNLADHTLSLPTEKIAGPINFLSNPIWALGNRN